ncbi:MAG: aminotransferase class IV [Chloroflexi bacterium]|nr:aminotransferase class IV [Chloroflexota bacterium]
MPATVKRLTKQGLASVAFSAGSLLDAAKHEPRAGVYTVGKTYQRTKSLLFGEHLSRLQESARQQGFALDCDPTRLRAALRQMILESDYGDVRFRISATAEPADETRLSIEPFQPPSAQLIERGARCITSAEVRHNPASKSSEWMHRRRALEAAQATGIYETFLVDAQGKLLEGASSNVYVILDGALRTASAGVLAGISRMIVLAVCESIVPLDPVAPNIADIDRFSEVFLSSSSRGILPVVELDGMPIGNGRVGAATLALRAAYQRWVDDHLEEL